MNELYVRYFIETCEWWVCQDEGLACKKLSGPWREKLLADKAMTTMKMRDA